MLNVFTEVSRLSMRGEGAERQRRKIGKVAAKAAGQVSGSRIYFGKRQEMHDARSSVDLLGVPKCYNPAAPNPL